MFVWSIRNGRNRQDILYQGMFRFVKLCKDSFSLRFIVRAIIPE